MNGITGIILVLFVTSSFGFHTMGLHQMISDHLVKRSPHQNGKKSAASMLVTNVDGDVVNIYELSQT